MQTASTHYHPLLIPLSLFGFTLIPESEEWLTGRDLLALFMLWKLNEVRRRSVWVHTRFCGRVERCAEWEGDCGMNGGVEATGSTGQVSWEFLPFSSVCRAGAGIQRNLLNIKRQPPAVFLSFYSIIDYSRWDSDISVYETVMAA